MSRSRKLALLIAAVVAALIVGIGAVAAQTDGDNDDRDAPDSTQQTDNDRDAPDADD